jgi:hypothetical protein
LPPQDSGQWFCTAFCRCDHGRAGAAMLMLEQDDSLHRWDNQRWI